MTIGKLGDTTPEYRRYFDFVNGNIFEFGRDSIFDKDSKKIL